MSRWCSRLSNLDRALAPLSPAAKPVTIKVSWRPGEPPIRSNDHGVWLTVPKQYAEDPVSGLTDQQRAMIGPDSQVIIVKYTRLWRPEMIDGQSRYRGDRWAALRGDYEPGEDLA